VFDCGVRSSRMTVVSKLIAISILFGSQITKQSDYIVHLDGTIEVRLSSSGYLQLGYWERR
jgi:hypothetical protein